MKRRKRCVVSSGEKKHYSYATYIYERLEGIKCILRATGQNYNCYLNCQLLTGISDLQNILVAKNLAENLTHGYY